MEESPKKSFKKGIFERASFSRLGEIVKLEDEVNKEDFVEIPEFVDEIIKKELSYFIENKKSYFGNDLSAVNQFANECDDDKWVTWINRLQQD